MILAIRHGPTKAKDQFSGHTPVKLTKQGYQKATEMAKKLSYLPFSHIFSSDIPSAAETGRMLASRTGVKQSKHKELRSLDGGRLVGLPNEIACKKIDSLIENPDKRAPGGDSVSNWLDDLFGFVDPLIRSPKLYAVFTHSRPIQALVARSKTGKVTKKSFNSAGMVPPTGAVFFGQDGKAKEID